MPRCTEQRDARETAPWLCDVSSETYAQAIVLKTLRNICLGPKQYVRPCLLYVYVNVNLEVHITRVWLPVSPGCHGSFGHRCGGFEVARAYPALLGAIVDYTSLLSFAQLCCIKAVPRHIVPP